MPPLPGKALKRQLPFRGDEGIFEESFIEERRAGLEQFINRLAIEMIPDGHLEIIEVHVSDANY